MGSWQILACGNTQTTRKSCMKYCSVDLTSSLILCFLTKSSVSITLTGQGVIAVRLVSTETLQQAVLRLVSPAHVLELLPAASEFMSQRLFKLCLMIILLSVDHCLMLDYKLPALLVHHCYCGAE